MFMFKINYSQWNYERRGYSDYKIKSCHYQKGLKSCNWGKHLQFLLIGVSTLADGKLNFSLPESPEIIHQLVETLIENSVLTRFFEKQNNGMREAERLRQRNREAQRKWARENCHPLVQPPVVSVGKMKPNQNQELRIQLKTPIGFQGLKLLLSHHLLFVMSTLIGSMNWKWRQPSNPGTLVYTWVAQVASNCFFPPSIFSFKYTRWGSPLMYQIKPPSAVFVFHMSASSNLGYSTSHPAICSEPGKAVDVPSTWTTRPLW